jgi:hypothetical protein
MDGWIGMGLATWCQTAGEGSNRQDWSPTGSQKRETGGGSIDSAG